MSKPSEYRAIAMWGKELGSGPDYIKRSQERAARDNAPVDAIYDRYLTTEGISGKLGVDYEWRCISDLEPDHATRLRYENA